ncbi:hypothetical protein HK105_205347 [Polyrhizophydium stewartii]|uniref:GPI inositol-deacylase n=1 Tax=Polyrhizophydium stewartii TaxID=2732419 RepID=A0ABR4N679_9FUNG|nr:GPI inositol deacylase [Polyrhizophydium stewartii]
MRLALAAVATTVLPLALWALLAFRIDPKACDGNYIAPHYVPQDVRSAPRSLAARYRLVLHREQQDVPLSNDVVTGIPVLFLPGNAGSFKQVRSFGSVAQRVWRWKRSEGAVQLPLDIYAVDTNYELSAFSDSVLLRQALFAADAVKTILARYEHLPDPPRSVIIVGHSMGGFVARLITLLPVLVRQQSYGPIPDPDEMPQLPAGSIEAIITLSSPHRHPPAPITRRIVDLYERANKLWRIGHDTVADITLVSVANGRKDVVLNSALTHLDGVIDPSRGLTVYATAVPRVWATSDHEGAVWCNQMLEIVAESIYDMHRRNATRALLTPDDRMRVLEQHFRGVRPKPHVAPPSSAAADPVVLVHAGQLSLPSLADPGSNHRSYELVLDAHAPRPVMRLLTSLPARGRAFNVTVTASAPGSVDVGPGLDDADVARLMLASAGRGDGGAVDITASAARLVPAATTKPFEIMFHPLHASRDDGRPAWTLIEFDTREIPLIEKEARVRIHVHAPQPRSGAQDAFLEASFDDFRQRAVVGVSSLGLIFGARRELSTGSLASHFVIPRIRDGRLRYHMRVEPHCDGSPVFTPFVEYSVPPSYDTKFVSNITDMIVSWYSDPRRPTEPEGLHLSVYSSNACPRATLHVRVHWLGSLAGVASDYASFFPAMLVGTALMFYCNYFGGPVVAATASPRTWSFEELVEKHFWSHLQTVFFIDFGSIYVPAFLALDRATFLGPRDVINIFGLTFWFVLATGTLLVLSAVLHVLVQLVAATLAWAFRPVYSSRMHAWFGLVLMCAVGLVPLYVVHIVAWAYLFGLTVVNCHASGSRARKAADHIALVAYTTLLPFSILERVANGVSFEANSPFSAVGLLTIVQNALHLWFVLGQRTRPGTGPREEMAWLGQMPDTAVTTVLVLVYGWQYTYVAPACFSLVMAWECALRLGLLRGRRVA